MYFLDELPITDICAKRRFKRLEQMSKDDQMLATTRHYLVLLGDVKALLSREDLDVSLLTGAHSTVWMKRKGERNLNETDIQNLIGCYGTVAQKELLDKFPKMREEFVQRIKEVKPLGLVLERAEMPYPNYFARISPKKKITFSPEEIITILEIIKKLGL